MTETIRDHAAALFIEQWKKKLPRALGPLARQAKAGEAIDLGRGMLPAAALWPVRKALRTGDPAAVQALNEIFAASPGAAERVLACIREWKEKWDLSLAADQLSIKSEGDPQLRLALQTLLDYFDVNGLLIELVIKYLAPQVDPRSINVDDIKANIVNVGGLMNIRQLVIALNLPENPPPPRLLRSKFFFLIPVFVVISSLLVVYQFILPLLQPKPHLTGDFNVAIAQFSGSDARQAADLSSSVYQRLVKCIDAETGAASCPKGMSDTGQFDIQVLSPRDTGTVSGKTVQARAENAAKLAEQVNADLVVFGMLTTGDAGSELQPEIYLANKKLADAQELSGYNSFGTGIRVGENISANGTARQELRDKLILRADALKSFLIGLNYFTRGKFDLANQYMSEAASSDGWSDSEGKEVLYMFLGNIAGQSNHIDQAEQYFQRALQLNPDYSRALLGQAEVAFFRSNGGCQPDQIDASGVTAAIDAYQRAGQARDQPPLADIGAKVRYRVARAHLCLIQAQQEEDTSQVENTFKEIIQEYEAGNARLKYLASESHADLGLLYLPLVSAQNTQAAYQRALSEYQTAIGLCDASSADRQAVFYSQVGFIQWRLNNPTAAKAAYDTAIQLDPGHAADYQQQYNRLVSGPAPTPAEDSNKKIKN
jgi:tetratricopeptide (TPR) repeat protein